MAANDFIWEPQMLDPEFSPRILGGMQSLAASPGFLQHADQNIDGGAVSHRNSKTYLQTMNI